MNKRNPEKRSRKKTYTIYKYEHALYLALAFALDSNVRMRNSAWLKKELIQLAICYGLIPFDAKIVANHGVSYWDNIVPQLMDKADKRYEGIYQPYKGQLIREYVAWIKELVIAGALIHCKDSEGADMEILLLNRLAQNYSERDVHEIVNQAQELKVFTHEFINKAIYFRKTGMDYLTVNY